MDRSPLYLAALASAAVPGLDPASVEALPSEPGQLFDVAFVQDTQHRRWVIRAPRTAAAGAQMEVTVSLLGLLARRLPFSVPTPKGFVPVKDCGRAAVYPYLPGQNVDFASLPPGPGLAAELGRTIAALHNADLRLFEEAGLPAYDPDTYRTRRLSELDRAAATGHVPTGLLSRWERSLEDVSLWRFAPTPTHGDLTGDQVLAVFDDETDASTGRIKAITGWEDAKVADPADDFAALVTQASPAAFETVVEAYAHARAERPDKHLETRARLVAEMRVLSELLAASTVGDQHEVERLSASLRRLDERVHAEEEAGNDYKTQGVRPALRVPLAVPPAVVAEEEDDDVAVMFAKTAPEAETADTSADTPADPLEPAEPAADPSPDPAPGPAPDPVPGRTDEAAPGSGPDPAEPAGRAEAAGDAEAAQGEPGDGPEPGPEFEPGFDPRR